MKTTFLLITRKFAYRKKKRKRDYDDTDEMHGINKITPKIIFTSLSQSSH